MTKQIERELKRYIEMCIRSNKEIIKEHPNYSDYFSGQTDALEQLAMYFDIDLD